MKRVFCDTNIWYGIAEGRTEIPKDIQLCTPITVVEELAITPNQEKDPVLVKKAIQIAMTHSIVNEVPPFHLIASLDGYGTSMADYTNVEGFLKYTKLMAGNKITAEFFEATREYRKSRKADYKKAAAVFNEVVNQAKALNPNKREHWLLDTTKDNRNLIKMWVKQATDHQLSDTFDWSQIEFFEDTMNYYFKELTLSQKNVKQNDIVDFLNTVYIQPSYQYWCLDKPWQRVFQNAKMSKYLFELIEL